MNIKYPNISVKLIGRDRNAFYILGAVKAALAKAGLPKEEQDTFYQEATSGNYDHLLTTVMQWVQIE
jgi:hypothetical protein